MARRRTADQPLSRLAVWARRIALFSLVAALLSIVIVRAGILEVEPAIATFGGALLLGVMGMLLALASFIVIWKDGLAGLSYGITAIAIGLALNAYPLYLGYRWTKLPAISDITTDVTDRPCFKKVVSMRPRGADPATCGANLYAAEQQRMAYPDITPLMVDAAPAVAYEAARTIIENRRWRIVDAQEPLPNRREGWIEAIARSPIMGFRDDIAVRVRTTSDGARIDIRSASRYGRYDFGTNVSRIRSLVSDIEDLAETPLKEKKKPAAPAKTPPAKQPPGQPTAKR